MVAALYSEDLPNSLKVFFDFGLLHFSYTNLIVYFHVLKYN